MSLYLPPIESFIADGTTEAQYKAALTSLHAVIAAVYAGQTDPSGFFLNPRKITQDMAVPSNYNAASVGPITVADGVTVTVGDNATWSVH